MKDWVGNTNSIFKTLGASNHTKKEREVNDYYATDPIAIDKLLKTGIKLSQKIWEPACGEGHLSERLKKIGYDVYSSDLIDRGYGEQADFLGFNTVNMWDGDILTNPPYKYALEFCNQALDLVKKGRQVFMFLKLTFLEGKARAKFFKEYPPKYVMVFSQRVLCAKNAQFGAMKKGGGSAVAYAWFVWEKGYKGNTEIKWI